MDQVLQGLKFFKRFDKNVRMKILSVAEYHFAKEHSTLFRQGDKGEHMYIILKGTVNIRIISDEHGGFEVPVTTLYDGEHFGELAIVG